MTTPDAFRRELEGVEARLLADLQVPGGARDERFGRGAAVLREEVLLHGAGVHADPHGDPVRPGGPQDLDRVPLPPMFPGLIRKAAAPASAQAIASR